MPRMRRRRRTVVSVCDLVGWLKIRLLFYRLKEVSKFKKRNIIPLFFETLHGEQVSKVATYRHMYRHEPKEPCHFVSLSVLYSIRYSIRAALQDSAFKVTHNEEKSINIWLRYDPKWIHDVLGHISAKY